jgi:DNA-binding MarR family transcriptional regulator
MANDRTSVRTTEDRAAASALRVTIARIYRALRLSTTSGITPSQGSVLFRIEQSEPVRMGVLAHHERITPATLSKVVDSLESLGLVERVPDPLDGRVTLLKVSRAGRELTEAQRRASTRALEQALAQLTPSDRDALLRSMSSLERLAEILLRGTDD